MFCTATKMPPSEYRRLTLVEYQAFIDAIERRGPSIEEMF